MVRATLYCTVLTAFSHIHSLRSDWLLIHCMPYSLPWYLRARTGARIRAFRNPALGSYHIIFARLPVQLYSYRTIDSTY